MQYKINIVKMLNRDAIVLWKYCIIKMLLNDERLYYVLASCHILISKQEDDGASGHSGRTGV